MRRTRRATSGRWASKTSRLASPLPRPSRSPAAAAAGTIALYINGQKLSVGGGGDTATAVATAIAAVVNGYQNGPVTAAAAAGVVTLTARHKGAFTQGIGVLVNFYDDEALPAGLALEIANGVTGTGNPDAADVVAAISDEWFYTIISPWSDSANMAIIEAELDSRFGGMDMRTGHVFTGMAGTHAQLTTYGSARNNEHSSFIGVKNPPQAPYLWAAVHGAVVEFNGAIDPARPSRRSTCRACCRPARRIASVVKSATCCCTMVAARSPSQDGIVQIVDHVPDQRLGIEDVSYLDVERCGRPTTCAMPSARPWPRTSRGTSSPTTAPTSTRPADRDAVDDRGRLIATAKSLEKAGLWRTSRTSRRTSSSSAAWSIATVSMPSSA